MRTGKCVSCKQVRVLGGRNLCKANCYKFHHDRHTLEKFPRITWRREDLIAEYNICKARGLSVREAAEKIGVGLSALRRAIQRHNLRLAAVGPRST